MQVELMAGITGYIRRYQYAKNMRIYETCTILAEKEFNKLQDQANFNKRVDPLKYIGKLIMSILSFSIAVALIYIIVLDFLDKKGQETETVNPLETLSNRL